MFVYVKLSTDPAPLKFGPGRIAKQFSNILVIFDSAGHVIARFSEYESFWQERDDLGAQEGALIW